MKTRYGVSPWLHQFPRSRRPEFPRFRGEASTDVVIVGGGLAGCAIAYTCAAAGLRPVLVERARIGEGSSGRGAGLLLPEPGPSFREVSSAHGLRAARTIFETWRAGSRDAAALMRRLGIRCGLEPLDVVVTADADGEKALRREFDARAAAGLDVSWLTPKTAARAVNRDVAAALRRRDAFSLDPYRACLGIAAAASKRRARIFERTVVKRVRPGRKDVEILVDGGVLRAQTVIIATGMASAEFKPLQRHLTPWETYFALTAPLPAAMRRQLADPSLAIADTRVPPRGLRWTGDDRLVLSGGDQPVPPGRRHDQVLVQRTGDLMYALLTMYPVISGLQPEYGWHASYGKTADGLMYIGPHRNYPRHLFALGGTPQSATGAFVAARLLARAALGTQEKGDRLFAFAR
jgi:glycine/D-amino acid oxidase-like deaminating enzyme